MNNQMNNKRKLYIYNPKQAQFYMSDGVTCIDTGIHDVTHKTYWVFKYEQAQPSYRKWVTREH